MDELTNSVNLRYSQRTWTWGELFPKGSLREELHRSEDSQLFTMLKPGAISRKRMSVETASNFL